MQQQQKKQLIVEYWSLDEYNCHEMIGHDNMIHLHTDSEEEVIYYFQMSQQIYMRSGIVRSMPHSLLGLPFGVRNVCVMGPKGLVRSIR